MAWPGLDHDEGPFYQTQALRPLSRRSSQTARAAGTPIAATAPRKSSTRCAQQQLAREEKPRYDGRLPRPHRSAARELTPVVRFKNPLDGEVVVDDLVHGRVVFQNAELDDLIIARSDGTPTYNFCVVVDDMDMGITHVIRGDDHLNNTPRQMNMLRALGRSPPLYAHVPMILGPTAPSSPSATAPSACCSTRRRATCPMRCSITWCASAGRTATRRCSRGEEMIAAFDIRDVNKAASAFNPEKLAVAQSAAHDARSAARCRRICASAATARAFEAATIGSSSRASILRSASAPRRCARWRSTACFFFPDRSRPSTRRRCAST